MNEPTQTPQIPQDLSWWKDTGFIHDFNFRKEIRKTLKGFCLIYLPHYLQLQPADFHPGLVDTLGNPLERFLAIEGFRGSAKSTFGSLALPLFAALEEPDRYPFIIPCADTSMQSALNVANIKQELENNALILQDYGKFTYKRVDDPTPEPTLESEEEWQAKNMLLSNGVRILARSRGQKIRGLRHRQHRPKLVVVDDPEDLDWVRTKENRDKTERWLTGEVIPAIDEVDGRAIVIGNRLSNDALMARLKKNKAFKYLAYPLVRDNGTITWKAKYPNQAALDRQRDLVGVNAYMREYLLKVIPDEGAVVKPEWIRYYDKEPEQAKNGLQGTGIDLAISKKETADCTAMVSGTSFNIDNIPQIYVKPDPINARLSFHETIETAKAVSIANPFGILFVESVQYQAAAIEEMERNMLPVQAMRPTTDKRARLQSIAPYLQNGTVKFPRTGCEDLIIQLLGFGVEEHDDLVDAFVYLVLGLVQQGIEAPTVIDLFAIKDD
ncbi:MAG: phage terminase large subunit [Patescibacteria group bacterium]|jgi:predicted phage terminase large subunit-like protein